MKRKTFLPLLLVLACVALVLHHGGLQKPAAYAVDSISLGMKEREARSVWEREGRKVWTLDNSFVGERVMYGGPTRFEAPEVRFDHEGKVISVKGYHLSRGSVPLLELDDVAARAEGLGTGPAPDVGWDWSKQEGETTCNRLVEGGVVTAKSRKVVPIIALPGFKKEPVNRVVIIQLQTMKRYDPFAGKRLPEEDDIQAGP